MNCPEIPLNADIIKEILKRRNSLQLRIFFSFLERTKFLMRRKIPKAIAISPAITPKIASAVVCSLPKAVNIDDWVFTKTKNDSASPIVLKEMTVMLLLFLSWQRWWIDSSNSMNESKAIVIAKIIECSFVGSSMKKSLRAWRR